MSGISTTSFFNSTGSSDSTNRSRRTALTSTPIRHEPRNAGRNSIVVSSNEVGKLFDSIKSLSDGLKRQNKLIEDVSTDMKGLKEEVQVLRNELAAIKQSQEERSMAVYEAHSGPIPKELRDDVNTIYNDASNADKRFHGHEGIDSAHNAGVRAYIVRQIDNEENGYPKSTIMKAVTRVFEAQRQKYLDGLPERQEATAKKLKDKIVTSRRRRLYVQRIKVANDEETEKLNTINLNYMSDEEDGTGQLEGKWIARSPSWRSTELNQLLAVLHERASSKNAKHPKNRRVRGPPSNRRMPCNPPQWAVNTTAPAEPIGEHQDDEQESDEDCPSSIVDRQIRQTEDDVGVEGHFSDDENDDDEDHLQRSRRNKRQLLEDSGDDEDDLPLTSAREQTVPMQKHGSNNNNNNSSKKQGQKRNHIKKGDRNTL